MTHSKLGLDEVGRLGELIYQRDIRATVETEDNIGKMVIIDIESGDYEIDSHDGLDAARNLHEKHPGASLYGVCVGYNVAASMGGVMERTSS